MRICALAALALVLAGCGERGPVAVACRGAAAIDFTCFERRYEALVPSRGAAAALRDLARERDRNGYARAACHQLTHRIGRAAGARAGISAFADGQTLCSSGYYHGVVEAVMERIGRGEVTARAASVCAALRARERHSADHYNCIHGMGHGFMGAFAGDVPTSLRGCDALADAWERHTCHGGVFMENLSALGNPERPPTALRPDQPLYPCTAIARRYRAACLDKQTSYALYVNHGDFAAVFALCAQVDRDVRSACDRGLGGDVATDTVKHLFDPAARTVTRRRLCGLGRSVRARRDCVAGVVDVVLRDLDGGAAQVREFCRELAGDLRVACVRAREEAYRRLPLQPGT